MLMAVSGWESTKGSPEPCFCLPATPVLPSHPSSSTLWRKEGSCYDFFSSRKEGSTVMVTNPSTPGTSSENTKESQLLLLEQGWRMAPKLLHQRTASCVLPHQPCRLIRGTRHFNQSRRSAQCWLSACFPFLRIR